MAVNKVKMRLQGHEKFPLREGWINKGLRIIPTQSDAFIVKEAPDIFGIGNNMVKSLRYWMKSMGLTNENGSELSALGKIIAKYDPYLEKDFTLWLLHSHIAKNIKEATTWFMFFNKCDVEEMEKDQIEQILFREISKYASGQSFSEKSLGVDIDVLLNMYSKTKDKIDPEDKSISPFVSLGLVKKVEGKYVKSHPILNCFSEMIVLYEVSLKLEDRESVSIEDIIENENGLRKIYNLTNVMANALLDKLDAAGYIRVDRTAGLDMIYQVEKLNPEKIIEDYYTN